MGFTISTSENTRTAYKTLVGKSGA